MNQWKEENGRRNYFMINLHKSMGSGRDQIGDPGSAVGLATYDIVAFGTCMVDPSNTISTGN